MLTDTLHIDTIALVAEVANTLSDTIVVAQVPSWQNGLEPELRNMQSSIHSAFLVVIALFFAIMAFKYSHLRRVVLKYGEDLLNSRHGRGNVFDERSTGDVRILIFLVLQSVVCCGILLSEGIVRIIYSNPALLTIGNVAATIGIVSLCYICQLAAYWLVAYAFTSEEGRMEWIRGFNASQGLLGLTMFIPAALIVFYPEYSKVFILLGIILYLLAKMTFIFKGFAIFYKKISSLLYFILYLCTLEIIPLILVYNSACVLVFNTL